MALSMIKFARLSDLGVLQFPVNFVADVVFNARLVVYFDIPVLTADHRIRFCVFAFLSNRVIFMERALGFVSAPGLK